MGRAKILTSQENTLSVVETSCNIKYIIPLPIDNVGEYIKMEKKDGQVIIYFTKKTNKVTLDIKEGVTISFD
jgi:hypothetical protein